MADNQTNSDKILYLLKTGGEQTARQLSDALGITSMGARQHLLQLRQQEFVSSTHRAEKVGRPAQYWRLTAKAEQRFPDTHNMLTLSLLDSVQSVYGDKGLSNILRQREHMIREQYLQRLSGDDAIEHKLDVLAQIRTEEGYMAEWQPADGGYLFIENHCPICQAASQCQKLCDSELALFRACLGEGVTIQRNEHILAGERRCCYQIKTGTSA